MESSSWSQLVRKQLRSDAQLMCFLFSFFARVAFLAPLSFRCAFRSFLPGLDFFRPAEALPSATSMLLASPFFWIRKSRISRGALTMVFLAVRLAVAFFFVPLRPRLAGVPFPIEAWVGRRRVR